MLGLVFVLLVCFLRRGLIGGLQTSGSLSPNGSCRARRRRLRRAPAGRRWPASGRRAAATKPRSRGPALEARGLTKSFGGLFANRDINFAVEQGELARHHRTQRRRQKHVLQDADLRDAADRRAHHLPRPRHHRHGCRQGLPARTDQELSGQPALYPTDPAPERRDRRARRAARHLLASICCVASTACRGSRRRSRALWRWSA